MPKLIMFMKRKEGVTFEKFRDHYESVHIPLVASWVGQLMSDHRRYYPKDHINLYIGREDEANTPANDGGVDYDAVSVYTIKDGALDELMRIAADPAFTRAVTEDEANFADRAVSRQALTEEIAGPGMI